MNFELNEEQQALQASLSRLLGDVYGFEQRRAIAATPAGWSEAVWRQLAELGLTALPLPQAHGGFGGGAVDLLPVMQELGRALSLEPFLASVVLGATALRLAGDDALQARLLPGVASGEVRLAWAHDEAAGHQAPLWIETVARHDGERWRLDGAKCNVLHATATHHVVVSARVAGAPDDAQGLALFLVDAEGPGVQCRAHRLVDDTPAGELRFESAAALPLHDPHDAAIAQRALEGTLAAGTAAVCADAVGLMESAYRLSVDYLKTRRQFGRLIGENQALRHRAAEMLVSLEMCRSMALVAAVAADDLDAPGARADLARAKLMIGRHGRSLCHAAIQLHGGIGMTEEYAVGHCLRRLALLDQLFGDVDAQSARLAAMA
ncbi:acyl-CoA dehydrogenase family protein [Variovorax sp.]|jgi:pimeloyl-CoA dehydrogenase|uniref:acyl-CoA dehydrogenase family protein n=1 Tax=Variovorax sp. TaxID=1871043 RepID=UPI00120E2868|nr:acyl-CoA dehydrogenase [Variovorax sp.]TAJ61432.1 MAG: acyl-CoA dehydrogenase [Variovorax sp.]